MEKTSLDQIAALHERRIDVGVLRKPDLLLPESVAVEEWHQSLLIAAIPKDHELAKLDGVRIADLRDQPIITYPRDAGIGLYWPFLQPPQWTRKSRQTSPEIVTHTRLSLPSHPRMDFGLD